MIEGRGLYFISQTPLLKASYFMDHFHQLHFFGQIARIANAVTPQSSPMPTPMHRKAEYKIEVLIPPNISDPLNLVNTLFKSIVKLFLFIWPKVSIFQNGHQMYVFR